LPWILVWNYSAWHHGQDSLVFVKFVRDDW
jgi:hypothetical protein